ncbi:MAG: SH3 domain-containing protein [Candidatus Ventricola sp.]
MKRIFIWMAAMLLAASAKAEIIPASGMGQIGYEAVVLCEELTIRSDTSTASSAAGRLQYGDVFACQQVLKDGWCDCFLSDIEGTGSAGWVRSDYVLIDPSYYLTEKSTPVYAWNEAAAKKVALLGAGEKLPILREEGDWLLVSLRGAVGWVRRDE